MASTMQVDIVSAEKAIFSGTAEALFAPAEMGEVGILPRHSQLLAKLRPGEVRIKIPNGDEQVVYVSGGILEVQPHVVTILSDTAERAADLDEAAALEAKRRAEQAMTDRSSDMDFAKAQAQLAEAVAQLRAISRLRKRGR